MNDDSGSRRKPTPGPAHLVSPAQDLRASAGHGFSGRRVALVAVISVVFLAVFVGLGGIGVAASSLPGAGAGKTPSADQYGYPQWVCLSKVQGKTRLRYKLLYADGPGDFDGWTVVRFYGQTRGACPPTS